LALKSCERMLTDATALSSRLSCGFLKPVDVGRACLLELNCKALGRQRRSNSNASGVFL
jgi:hypothetical protein